MITRYDISISKNKDVFGDFVTYTEHVEAVAALQDKLDAVTTCIRSKFEQYPLFASELLDLLQDADVASSEEDDTFGKVMRYDTQPDTKVKYAFPHNGTDCDQKRASLHLIAGETYTVSDVEAHSWNTDVYLEEVKGIAFNSAMFKNV